MIRFLTMCALLAWVFPADTLASDDDALLQGRIEAHISFLADDLLRGRQPGTEGYDIAASYVASQFRQMGLLPAGDDGSYFQAVPLRRAWLEENSATLTIERDGQTAQLAFLEDFYRSPSTIHTRSEVSAPMVFAGYGIDAPLLEYNDYQDLDVEGKIVVLIMGQPLDFPSEEGAHFSSSRELGKNAIKRGAVGIVYIHTPRASQRFAWDRMHSMVGTPAMSWLNKDGEVYPDFSQLKGGVVIRSGAADVLFEGAPFSLEDVLTRDEAGESIPVFELDGRMSLSQVSSHETISSPNVAAVLPGSDPLLNDEYMVYIAHLDHIGELHGEGHDDAINNGALDNASGTAVMLETARIFTEQEAPRRSVLFIAVTGEEKGLLGSEYFAVNPTVPIEKLAGVVNLDMPLLLYDFGDVIAFGAEHSTMGDAVQLAADHAGVALTPDPFPEQNIFVRSDHYRFVQQGVPAVFLVTGTISRDGSTDTQPVFEAFLKDHYHKPSDDLDQPIHYGAAARFTRINHGIGDIIANQLERPQWREGDFFGDTYGPHAATRQ